MRNIKRGSSAALLPALLVALMATLWFGHAPVASAASRERGPRTPWMQQARELAAGEAAADTQQSYFGDLTVEPGQVLPGDVVVYEGDVTLQSAGRIAGNLVVYRGDVEIQSGASTGGNVTAFSGDVEVAGEIGGNLAALNGDVTLENSARVNGDVSLVNGDLERSEGAFVGGNVAKGPSLVLPDLPAAPFPRVPGMGQNDVSGAARSWAWSLGAFVTRVIGVGLFALLAGLLIAVLMLVRPQAVEEFQRTLVAEPALSFVAGIVANLGVLFLSVLFAITLCLIPLSIVAWLVLAALNVAGWAAIAAAVAGRVRGSLKSSLKPELMTGLIAAVLIGGLGLLWAMGGCFRFVGMATALIVSSVGVGAVLLPLFRRRRNGISGPGMSPAGPEPADLTTKRTGAVEGVALLPAPQPEPASAAETALGPEATEEQDDFLLIGGIGPVSVARLHAAGVRTFAQLAALSPEQVGEIIGWTAERVARGTIIEQARALAAAT